MGDKPNPLQAMALGMAARSLAATVMIPITVLKTRFESGQFGYTRMTTALITIYSTEGLRGLTCGLMATLARDAPYSGLYLMFYTQLKNNLVPRIDTATGGNLTGGPTSHFACGIAAGFLASLVTHPADVVKTKMQIQPQVYSNLTRTTKLIMVKSGPRISDRLRAQNAATRPHVSTGMDRLRRDYETPGSQVGASHWLRFNLA